MASKAVREGTRGLFYACNRFELRGLGRNRAEAGRIFWASDAVDRARFWWRCVGDTSIRSIRHLYISTSETDGIEVHATEGEGVEVTIFAQTYKEALRVTIAGTQVEYAVRETLHDARSDGASAGADPGWINPTKDMHLTAPGGAAQPWQTLSADEPGTSYYFNKLVREGYKRIAEDLVSGHACVQTIESVVKGMRKLEHAMGKPGKEYALMEPWANDDSREESEVTVSLRQHPSWWRRCVEVYLRWWYS